MSKLSQLLLPAWARADHPLLQYELSHYHAVGGGRLKWQVAALSLALVGAALVYALTLLRPAPSQNLAGLIWQSLYNPTLIVQLFTLILALTLGAAAVGGERSRKTWDNLRATENGAALVLRARWAGILYRLRAPIATILLARCILAAGMLYDLTAFDGLYPQMLAANAKPALPEWRLELLLIALAVTVRLLLPIAQIATFAALGILVSVAIRQRLLAIVLQLLFIAGQLALAGAGAFVLARALGAGAPQATDLSYALALAYSGFGDWGLLLMQLGSLGELWQRLPNGWTMSLSLMLLLGALALAADGAMWLAGRLSESRG